MQEFSKAIEMFEARLLSVENNVQKEVQSVRSIADTMLTAVNKLTSASASAPGLTAAVGGAGAGSTVAGAPGASANLTNV